MKKSTIDNILIAIFFLIVLNGLVFMIVQLLRGDVFNGNLAYEDIRIQLSFDPRTPGGQSHQEVGDWIILEMDKAGYRIEEQVAEMDGHSIRNIIAKRGRGTPWIILGAHYDTRMQADRDPDPARRSMPVPGANDGASGVALLLGLARVLPQDLTGEVWLVFFDAEDQGTLPGWEWILGSQYFARSLEGTPDGVIIVDMIGDADLQIYKERNSDPALMAEIWETADRAGFDQYFLPDFKHQMLDDHLPFIEQGIPAVLLIDFDYPWWHTTADTLDKVSADSLDVVGETLLRWLNGKMN